MKKLIVVTILACMLLAMSVQAVWASPPATNPIIHIVQWGENLIGIANRYGTSVWAIMQANNIGNQNRIFAGQRLVIPGAAAPAPVPSACSYVVCNGDNLTGIAFRFGVTVSAIMRANMIVNPNMIYAGQRLAIPCAPAPAPPPAPAPAPGGVYYVVRWGDTLAKIAMRFGVSSWAIVRANNIANPNVIYPGRRLFIPTGTPVVQPQPNRPGCEHLTSPLAGAVLSGIVQAKGTADLTNFWYYKLEFRKDGLDQWHYITGAETPVHSGLLGNWDTRPLANGGYTFRLVVVDRTGNYPPPCEIPVQLKN